MKKKIVIIGAGPGGLTAGMLLSHRGYEVHIYEKESYVGGRNGQIEMDGFRFDIGPTFLLLKSTLEEVFELTGRKMDDYIDTVALDPLYRLSWTDKHIDMTPDHEKMKEEIARVFPGQEKGYDKYLAREEKRLKYLLPCLGRHYCSTMQLINSWKLIRALPHIALGRSLFDVLGDYFTDDDLKLAFTFQAKYIGMSPWTCPGLFTILSYMEHAHGVHHVQGGLSKIGDAMADVIRENGGHIHLGSPVTKVNVEGRKATSIEVVGEKISFDELMINADFGHMIGNLFDEGVLKKYPQKKRGKLKYSCSTFMLYLGVDEVYEEEKHHQIIFSSDYRKNIEAISKFQSDSIEDFSVYVRNASVTDPSIAPAGKSALYVLVPVPNLKADIDWDDIKDDFAQEVLEKIERRTSMKNLREKVTCMKAVSPKDWERSGIHLGATFSLAHGLDQMLHLRPHNLFQGFHNLYLLGGGTHPGSGLPAIYESGRIASDMIDKKHAGTS